MKQCMEADNQQQVSRKQRKHKNLETIGNQEIIDDTGEAEDQVH